MKSAMDCSHGGSHDPSLPATMLSHMSIPESTSWTEFGERPLKSSSSSRLHPEVPWIGAQMPDAMSQLVGPAGLSSFGRKTESVPKEECSPSLFSLVRHDSAPELSNLSEIVATRGSSPPRAAWEPPYPRRISGDFHRISPNQVGELCNSNLPPRCPDSEYRRLALREGSWFPCTSLTGQPRLERISESFAEPTVETKENSSWYSTHGKAGTFAHVAQNHARSPCTSLVNDHSLERISEGPSGIKLTPSLGVSNKLLNPGCNCLSSEAPKTQVWGSIP
jgi:hypothetical protein